MVRFNLSPLDASSGAALTATSIAALGSAAAPAGAPALTMEVMRGASHDCRRENGNRGMHLEIGSDRGLEKSCAARTSCPISHCAKPSEKVGCFDRDDGTQGWKYDNV
jgi:hypothetical protein